MKAYGGVDMWIHVFLTSALVGGECSASRPGPFLYLRGKSPRYPLDRSVGGLRYRSRYDVDKRKFFTLAGLELRPFGRPVP
jgi:hypothetical protein